ncbi:MAG TPA: response regulator transcription factor [Prolixibacteraceae bacterium]|nr:response regulator transcription factor [Prolixibacteraceae bacterium]
MNTEHLSIDVLIADSQFLTALALKQLLLDHRSYSIVGTAETKNELTRLLMNTGEVLLVVDPVSVDFDGLDDFKQFIQKYPQVKVLVFTNPLTKADLIELTKDGFKHIIYKTIDRDDLFTALEYTMKGKKYYSSELLELMLEMNMGRQTMEESKALTPSETEIVKMVAQGFTTKEIAFRKNISFHTVNTHRKNIFRKLEVSNVSELIMKAIKLGWIDTIEYYI